MDELQRNIIEGTIESSDLLAEFDRLIDRLVDETKQHIHFDAKYLTKCGRVDDEVLDAYSELTKTSDLDYLLKTVIVNRLSNKLESLKDYNISK